MALWFFNSFGIVILDDLMSSTTLNVDYNFQTYSRKTGFLNPLYLPLPLMLGRLCLPWPLLVEAVSHFWIYSTAVPQIGPSEASSLFEEDP